MSCSVKFRSELMLYIFRNNILRSVECMILNQLLLTIIWKRMVHWLVYETDVSLRCFAVEMYEFMYKVGDFLWCTATRSFPCVHKQGPYNTELCVEGYGLYVPGSPLWGSIVYKDECLFVCLFVCTLCKSTFLNRSEPNFAHVSPLVWKRP